MSSPAYNKFSLLQTDNTFVDNANICTPTFSITCILSPLSSAPVKAEVPEEKKYIFSLRDGIFPEMKIKIETVDTKERLVVDAPLDSGATGLYIDKEFVKMNRLNTRKLHTPIPVYNV